MKISCQLWVGSITWLLYVFNFMFHVVIICVVFVLFASILSTVRGVRQCMSTMSTILSKLLTILRGVWTVDTEYRKDYHRYWYDATAICRCRILWVWGCDGFWYFKFNLDNYRTILFSRRQMSSHVSSHSSNSVRAETVDHPREADYRMSWTGLDVCWLCAVNVVNLSLNGWLLYFMFLSHVNILYIVYCIPSVVKST